MIDDLADAAWKGELNDLFLRIGHRFDRANARRRMRDYVRSCSVRSAARTAGNWPNTPATPDGLQRLLSGATGNADDVRDDLVTTY
ncbi:hypothetical protein OG985_45870 [Streptomyces sp. NBC_00289]|uniref:hypothetical protein n=1 Tax=Streptomyces sp. NBC_00289 TaxID=2975703 RepID=UPI00325600AB